MERDRQEAASNWWPVAGQKGLQCDARADAVACGTAVSAVASGPPAGLLWLPALVASERDGSEDPQDPLCRNWGAEQSG